MSDARHHRAHAPGPVVVLVPVPFEGGSPKEAREVKPRPVSPAGSSAVAPGAAHPGEAQQGGGPAPLARRSAPQRRSGP